MININSTEEERYNLLKDRTLTVHMWDNTKSMVLKNPDESVAKAVKRTANELNIVGNIVKLEGLDEDIKITNDTIKESINSMTKQRSDLNNLFKLFTILNMIIKEAILIEVEEFRHFNKPQKMQLVKGEYQYISAFCDKEKLYPVKITIEQRHQKKDSNIHLIITVGTISLSELKKEGFSCPGMHLHEGKESLDSGRNPSFNISISNLIKYFNKNEAILIKNLPNGLLSKEQIEIKEKLIRFDKEKDEARQISLYTKEIKEAEERGDDIIYNFIPNICAEKMRKVMIKSGICHMPFIDEKGCLNMAIKKEDNHEFLKIQKTILENIIKDKSLVLVGKKDIEKMIENINELIEHGDD